MSKARVLLTVILVLFGHATIAAGDEKDSARTLVVGTKQSPPFAFSNAEGDWEGISIDLWKRIASDLDLDYEFRDLSLDELISGLETGELDAAVAAISVTAERLQRLEFCHPHFTTGLGIAVPSNARGNPFNLIRKVVSPRLLMLVGIMIGIVAVCGLLFWRFERGVNQGMFGGKRRQGIEMGVWWSIILLLGHKGVTPVSRAGRLVAVSAMFASLLLLSVLTGVITSVLTVQQLDAGIDDPSDLRRTRVVTVASSTAADYLRRQRIAFRTRESAADALQDVADGKADAAVYDKPLLRYLANDQFSATIRVLPVSFNTQEYAIALPAESRLRKSLNTALLRYKSSEAWDELIYQYLGE